MLNYTIRRLVLSIPTLLFIALVIFLLLELAPGDPMGQMPLTIPDDVKQRMREALGLGEPWYTRFYLWLYQFFIVEPQYWIDGIFGTNFADGAQRIISFQSRSPVFDTIAERIPQTLWVVGMSYVVGVAIALPIGIISGPPSRTTSRRFRVGIAEAAADFLSFALSSEAPALASR